MRCVLFSRHRTKVFSLIEYREWDLNPHSHHWPKDFKSFVSTYSTIAALVRKYAAKVRLF